MPCDEAEVGRGHVHMTSELRGGRVCQIRITVREVAWIYYYGAVQNPDQGGRGSYIICTWPQRPFIEHVLKIGRFLAFLSAMKEENLA